MSPRRQTVLVAALLSGIALLLTWPLVSRLSSAVDGPGDPLLEAWILAWDLHALRHAPLQLFDAPIFHPHRWTLAYSDHLLGLLPLAAPAYLVGGEPILVHNVVLLATFPLSGLTMFWLVRHLTGRPGAGVVAGILYAFSHYRFGQLGHVQVLSHQWLPLLLLALHRVVTGGARWRDVALAAVAFVLQALSSGYHAYAAAIALGVFVAWAAAPADRPPLGRAARRGLVAAALAAAILVPVFLPYYVVRREVGLTRHLSEVRHYSARPSSYLAAPPDNRWLGELTQPLRRPEGVLFPGVVMLVLAAAGAVTAFARANTQPEDELRASAPPTPPGRRIWPRGLDIVLAALLVVTLLNALLVGGFAFRVGPIRIAQRDPGLSAALIAAALVVRRLAHARPVALPGLGWLRSLGGPRAAGYYVGLTVVGLLCSFGPTLWIWDQPMAEPLYRQLYKLVPGLNGLRVPARFAVLVSTGLAVLAGYGVAAIAHPRRPRKARAALVTALSALAVLEAWAVPLPLDEVAFKPEAADQWLATTGSPGAVVVLPMYRDPHGHLEAGRMLAAVAHWRPLVNGYSGFFPPGYWETVESLNTFPAAEAVARLRALRVRYVVVSLAQYPDEARVRMEIALETLPAGVERAATLEDAVILELRSPP